MKFENVPFEKGLPLIGNLIPYSKDRLGFLLEMQKTWRQL